jgi:hypothetical protein
LAGLSSFFLQYIPYGDNFRRNVAIHIGGLTDGLLPLPYTTSLAAMLEVKGWTLVQPLLSSSHLGYGMSSLQKDSEEIDMLLRFLARKWGWDDLRDGVPDRVNVIIVGHSTGAYSEHHNE